MPNTAEHLNGLYRDYLSNRDATADQFWPAVRSYVTKCLTSIPKYLQGDLSQDIVIEVLIKIDGVRLRVSFTKWLNGIIHNMRADRFRAEMTEHASVSFSRSAIEDQGGMIREFEQSDELYPSDESDLVTDEHRASRAAIALDKIRASLNKRGDIELLDLLRSGLSLSQAATRKGISYSAAQRRFARLKTKLAKSV